MEALRRAGRKGEGVFHRNEDGANALEFALVLPILIVLIFGGINAAIAWDYRLQMNHAARETSRFAATFSGSGDEAWFNEVLKRALVVGAGRLNPRDPTLTICVSVGDTGAAIRQTGQGSSSYAVATAAAEFIDSGDGTEVDEHCLTGAEVDGLTGSRVQVVIRSQTSLNAVLFRMDGINLESKGFAVYEG